MQTKKPLSQLCPVANIIDSSETPIHPRCLGKNFNFLFVGSFGNFPNRDALNYFLDMVWPRLRERAAEEICLLVVDKGLTDAFRAEIDGSPGVQTIGEVDDLTP